MSRSQRSSVSNREKTKNQPVIAIVSSLIQNSLLDFLRFQQVRQRLASYLGFPYFRFCVVLTLGLLLFLLDDTKRKYVAAASTTTRPGGSHLPSRGKHQSSCQRLSRHQPRTLGRAGPACKLTTSNHTLNYSVAEKKKKVEEETDPSPSPTSSENKPPIRPSIHPPVHPTI